MILPDFEVFAPLPLCAFALKPVGGQNFND